MNPTDEQVAEIIRRSSEGESVALTIRNMDMDLNSTLEYMKRYQDELRAAKETFRQKEKALGK